MSTEVTTADGIRTRRHTESDRRGAASHGGRRAGPMQPLPLGARGIACVDGRERWERRAPPMCRRACNEAREAGE